MKKIFVLSFFLIISLVGFSQTKTKKPEFGSNKLITHFTSYNFFVGKDAASFRTTPKALGSGISDFSQVYTVFNLWLLRPVEHNIGLITTVGLDLTKYRFADNLYFDTNNDKILTDNDSSHYYNPSFFSPQGSKLVMGKLYIPLIVYLPVSHWFKPGNEDFGLYFGAIYRPYLFSYHKLNYMNTQNQPVKNKTPNIFIAKYFNQNDVVVKAGIKIKGIFLFGQYSVLPFFSNELNYDIHEAKVGINIFLNLTSRLEKKLKELEDDDNGGFGTETK